MTVDLSSDLSNWMGNLPEAVRNIPIIYLAIPGSHDSLMNFVSRRSGRAPDGPTWLRPMYIVAPFIIKGWVVTQSYSIVDQLRNGIRYFDLRLAYHRGQYRFCHGLYSPYRVEELAKVNEFLNQHPREVIILDLQHVYKCDAKLKQQLCTLLKNIFGEKICDRQENPLLKCSLNSLTRKSVQAMIIFRHYVDDDGLFLTDHWPTPWPNKTSTKALKVFLENNIKDRQPDEGYVTQCVLTPNGKFLMLHMTKSIRSACAKPVIRKMLDWIRKRECGLDMWPSHNVFIADYVNLDDNAFTKAVLSINEKLIIRMKIRENLEYRRRFNRKLKL